MNQQEKKESSPILTKKEIFEAMKTCFTETERKYLSYGDFHFLLHKDGKIGRTTLGRKKKLYQQWQKQLKNNIVYNGWEYPYRKFVYESSRFKEITESLIKEKKLKKTWIKEKPHYYLPENEKINLKDINQIRQQKLIAECSGLNSHTGGKHLMVKYYGLPFSYPPSYPNSLYKTYKFKPELDKLAIEFEKNAKKFLDIMRKLTSFMVNDMINEIKKGNFKEADKKLAFIFLNQRLTYSLDENKEFRWTGDGKTLEYLPKNYIIDPKVSDILYYFVKFEFFWLSKLIVIAPEPEIKQLKKSGYDSAKTKQTIRQYIREC